MKTRTKIIIGAAVLLPIAVVATGGGSTEEATAPPATTTTTEAPNPSASTTTTTIPAIDPEVFAELVGSLPEEVVVTGGTFVEVDGEFWNDEGGTVYSLDSDSGPLVWIRFDGGLYVALGTTREISGLGSFGASDSPVVEAARALFLEGR